MWDVETGALVWVGPPAAQIVADTDWIASAGHLYIPVFDVDAILRDAGARTNLRVCENDLRAIPISPPPAPDTYWAPAAACVAPK
jgi:hypothetical protein